MAIDMSTAELGVTKPQPQDVAKRWLRARRVQPPIERAADENKNPMNPTTLVQVAYDLFVERQELRDKIVGSERRVMEPESNGQMTFGAISTEWENLISGQITDKPLSLDEKRALIKQGKINTLLPEIDTKHSDIAIINMSQQRIAEVDASLDEVFSDPEVYQKFQADLSHQVEVRRRAREASGLVRFQHEAELLALKLARRAQVESRTLTSAEKRVVTDNQTLGQEARERAVELATNPEVFDRLRVDELRRYKAQLDKDHFAETPSREKYLGRIEEYWTEGKRVLLSGETGTGKTEIVKHASNKLFGVTPEYVTGHQDMSIYELLGKTGFQAQTGDVFRPSPLIRAMTGRNGQGQPFLFDEIDRCPNPALMGIKTILNARPGEKGIKVQTDGAGSFNVGVDYAVSATANIKSDKHLTATELDPAIVRVFDAPLEIDYMPAPEVYDVVLAALMDKRSGIPLSEHEATVMLKNLCDAASWIQDAYQGRKIVTDPSSNSFLEARGQGSTGKSASLKKALLDPGRTIDMLKGWSGAQARNISFEDYLNGRVTEFINNRAYPEDDRYYLAEIFALKGFLKGVKVDQLSVPGLTQATLDKWNGGTKTSKKKGGVVSSGYLTADRVARLDPYKKFKRPVNLEAAEMLEEAETTGEATTGETHEASDFAEVKEIMGGDFFGPEEVENALDYELDRSRIPDIPFSIEELRKAKARGEFLMLFVPETTHGNPITMKRLHDDQSPKIEASGKGKVLYDTDWYQWEEFFTTDTPRPAWRLVTKEVIPGSTNHNYLEQTRDIINYFNILYPGGTGLPLDYAEAIGEFSKLSSEIERTLSGSRWAESAKLLASLEINQMLRQSPVEALYAGLVYLQTRNERLLENMYAWTNRQTSHGYLLYVGRAGTRGARVYRWLPGHSGGNLGVVVSR